MRSSRAGFLVLVTILCFGITAMCATPLCNPPFSVDSLILIEGSEALLREADGAEITATEDGKGVRLARSSLRGSFTTAPVCTKFVFNEAIPSWNGTARPGSSFRIHVRVRRDSDGWSPWLEFGSWGTPPPREQEPLTSFDGGRAEIDILFADSPAGEFQFRVDLFRERKDLESPKISLLAFSYSNTLEDEELWRRLHSESQPRDDLKPSPIDLPVPFRSQRWEDPSIANNVCSPACVAMVLEMFGIEVDTARMARLAFDPDHGIYGNWSRNVQAAAHLGARGYVDRFRSWDRVRRELERGSPIVASIRFQRGELRDPPYESSTGHLLVVRGFTPEGDIITNDPFLDAENGGDGCVWKADDLAAAWFDRGGVGYILNRP